MDLCNKCNKECEQVWLCHACYLDFCETCEPELVYFEHEFHCPDCINELYKRLHKYDQRN